MAVIIALAAAFILGSVTGASAQAMRHHMMAHRTKHSAMMHQQMTMHHRMMMNHKMTPRH